MTVALVRPPDAATKSALPFAACLSSESTEWATPRDFLAAMARRWGRFWLDAAATRATTAAPAWYDREQDGLAQSWEPPPGERGPVWLNPPYGVDEKACVPACAKKRCVRRGFHLSSPVPGIGAWMNKARDEALRWGGPVVTLPPARPDTRWWRDALLRQPEAAGRYVGSMADPYGGPFAALWPTLEWRLYRWEHLVVEVANLEGRLSFGQQGKVHPAPFPSACVAFYAPGR